MCTLRERSPSRRRPSRAVYSMLACPSLSSSAESAVTVAAAVTPTSSTDPWRLWSLV